MKSLYSVALFALFTNVASAESISAFVTQGYEFDDATKQFFTDRNYDKITVYIVNPDAPTESPDFNKVVKLCGYTEKPRDDEGRVANAVAQNLLGTDFQFPVFVTDANCFNLTDVINSIVKKTSPFNPIDADVLFKEYQENKYAFNQKYNNKIISVQGLLRFIDANGIISLATSKTFHSVRCLVQNKDMVLNLKKDQTITITGRYVQESHLTDLELYNCFIK